ncbi:hypothetical protein KIF24_05485 [Micromonospora sp. Llam7]|uniref:hypothetical protein n=1 Tax=Micromonospora tarapacensis TaxID=2835305 RepID=UPI001C83AA4F|nr:hypothetical protein [Micromonospora tarapacensis]MBX7265550.1 hypothetical protein [Micromonospora tarapacensis]
MARRNIRVSDLTGEPIKKRHDIVTVVVHRHPSLQEGAVIMEAALDELVGIDSEQLAVIELWFANGQEVMLNIKADAFNSLATTSPMAELLAKAQKRKRWYIALERKAHRALSRKDVIGLPRST